MRELENKANLVPLNLDECGICSNPVTALTHFCTNCGSALCGDCAEDHACGDCSGEDECEAEAWSECYHCGKHRHECGCEEKIMQNIRARWDLENPGL